jgi:Flp pilus assembly protein TadB
MFGMTPESSMIAVATFGFFFALWLIGLTWWSMRHVKADEMVKSRLGLSLAPRSRSTTERELTLWIDGKRVSTRVADRQVYSMAHRFMRFYRETGFRMPAIVFLLWIILLMPIAFFVPYYFLHNLLIGLLTAGVVPWLFWIFACQRIDKRRALFDRQFVDALELAARSLRVGHPLNGAFRLIAEEIPAPVGRIFADICQQEDLGVAMDDALQNVASDTDYANLRTFAAAVAVHRQSGGSMADMMDRLAYVMRDRMRLGRRINVLTAQTQFSKRILLVLPVLMFIVLNLMSPKYMDPLYSTFVGRMILLACIAMLITGAALMNWVAKISY